MGHLKINCFKPKHTIILKPRTIAIREIKWEVLCVENVMLELFRNSIFLKTELWREAMELWSSSWDPRATCGPRPFPKWPVQPLVSHNINTLKISIFYIKNPLLHFAISLVSEWPAVKTVAHHSYSHLKSIILLRKWYKTPVTLLTSFVFLNSITLYWCFVEQQKMKANLD
jgi:hypothetical protein